MVLWWGTAHVLPVREQRSVGLGGSCLQGDFLLPFVTPAAFELWRAQPNSNATALPQLHEVLFCMLNNGTLCLSQLLRIHQQYLINYHRHLFALTFMTPRRSHNLNSVCMWISMSILMSELTAPWLCCNMFDSSKPGVCQLCRGRGWRPGVALTLTQPDSAQAAGWSS